MRSYRFPTALASGNPPASRSRRRTPPRLRPPSGRRGETQRYFQPLEAPYPFLLSLAYCPQAVAVTDNATLSLCIMDLATASQSDCRISQAGNKFMAELIQENLFCPPQFVMCMLWYWPAS